MWKLVYALRSHSFGTVWCRLVSDSRLVRESPLDSSETEHARVGLVASSELGLLCAMAPASRYTKHWTYKKHKMLAMFRS